MSNKKSNINNTLSIFSNQQHLADQLNFNKRVKGWSNASISSSWKNNEFLVEKKNDKSFPMTTNQSFLAIGKKKKNKNNKKGPEKLIKDKAIQNINTSTTNDPIPDLDQVPPNWIANPGVDQVIIERIKEENKWIGDQYVYNSSTSLPSPPKTIEEIKSKSEFDQKLHQEQEPTTSSMTNIRNVSKLNDPLIQTTSREHSLVQHSQYFESLSLQYELEMNEIKQKFRLMGISTIPIPCEETTSINLKYLHNFIQRYCFNPQFGLQLLSQLNNSIYNIEMKDIDNDNLKTPYFRILETIKSDLINVVDVKKRLQYEVKEMHEKLNKYKEKEKIVIPVENMDETSEIIKQLKESNEEYIKKISKLEDKIKKLKDEYDNLFNKLDTVSFLEIKNVKKQMSYVENKMKEEGKQGTKDLEALKKKYEIEAEQEVKIKEIKYWEELCERLKKVEDNILVTMNVNKNLIKQNSTLSREKLEFKAKVESLKKLVENHRKSDMNIDRKKIAYQKLVKISHESEELEKKKDKDILPLHVSPQVFKEGFKQRELLTPYSKTPLSNENNFTPITSPMPSPMPYSGFSTPTYLDN